MKAETPEQKRALAKHLAEHDPETLAFLKAASEEFGLLDRVLYRSLSGAEAKPSSGYSEEEKSAERPTDGPQGQGSRLCWWLQPCEWVNGE